MPQTYLQGPYVDQWKRLYPGVQFPTPEKYPHMYDSSQPFTQFTDEVDPDNQQCTDSKYCPKGLIDYQCHLKYSCYLNLINLGLHFFGFLIAFFCIIVALTKIFIFVGKLLKKLAIITKLLLCFGSCLKSISFGVLGDQIYYQEEVDPEKKLTKQQLILKKKLRELNLQINMQQLDQFKVNKILELIQDYSVISDDIINKEDKKERQSEVKTTKIVPLCPDQ